MPTLDETIKRLRQAPEGDPISITGRGEEFALGDEPVTQQEEGPNKYKKILSFIDAEIMTIRQPYEQAQEHKSRVISKAMRHNIPQERLSNIMARLGYDKLKEPKIPEHLMKARLDIMKDLDSSTKTDELDKERRKTYLDVHKAVLSATDDVDLAHSEAEATVKKIFDERGKKELLAEITKKYKDKKLLRRLKIEKKEEAKATPVDKEEVLEEGNPLGFTSEELASVGGSVPIKPKATAQKSGVETKLASISSSTDQISYLSSRIPELKKELKQSRRIKGKGKKSKTLKLTNELLSALKQYKKISGKKYRRK